MAIELGPGMTDSDLERIRSTLKLPDVRFAFYTSAWDKDSRGILEIPEAVDSFYQATLLLQELNVPRDRIEHNSAVLLEACWMLRQGHNVKWIEAPRGTPYRLIVQKEEA